MTNLEEDESKNSNCCNAPLKENSDICSECNGYCTTIAEEKEVKYVPYHIGKGNK